MDGLNFDRHLSQLEPTEEKCTIHDMQMVRHKRKNIKPFCMSCTAERIQSETVQIARDASIQHEKRRTYNWLNDLSILSDETIRNARFDNYDEDEPETVMNKKKTRLLAGEYLKRKVFNTILSGLPGTGKSHLAMSMLQAVNENSEPYKKCLFVSVDELMRRIKDSFNSKVPDYTEQKMVEMLTEADLLVLDDLGAETGAIGSMKSATDFTTKTLYAIVNGRMNKSTIITTNLSSAELNQMYDRNLLSRMYRGAKAAGSILTFKETSDKRSDIVF